MSLSDSLTCQRCAQLHLPRQPLMCFPLEHRPEYTQFPGAWGGLSLFVSLGHRGTLAWNYVFKLMQSKAPGVLCRAAFDPTQSALPQGGVKYVFDYCMCRAWGDLVQDVGAAADPLDAGAFGVGRKPLAAHVTLLVTAETPVAVVDAIAECRGWATDSSCLPGRAPPPPPFPGGGSDAIPLPRGGSGNSASAPSPGSQPTAGDESLPGATDAPVSVADLSLTPDEDPDVEDVDLRNVVRLLLSTLKSDAPVDLCTEALLYVYFIKHNQPFFAGSLQRIVSLDDGHCAAVLRDAAAFAYPDDDYGSDEWAHSCVPEILAAALSCHESIIGHADVFAVAETTVSAVAETTPFPTPWSKHCHSELETHTTMQALSSDSNELFEDQPAR